MLSPSIIVSYLEPPSPGRLSTGWDQAATGVASDLDSVRFYERKAIERGVFYGVFLYRVPCCIQGTFGLPSLLWIAWKTDYQVGQKGPIKSALTGDTENC